MGVLTYKDVPKKEWVGVYSNYRGCVMDNKVRFVGDEVAAVAAVDHETAEKALKLIKVEYKPLLPVFDVFAAMESCLLYTSRCV